MFKTVDHFRGRLIPYKSSNWPVRIGSLNSLYRFGSLARMEAHTPPNSGNFELWTALNRAGVRFRAFEAADVVLLERAGESSELSLPIHDLVQVFKVAVGDSVVLLNREARVEALVDMALKPDFVLEDFSTVRAILLAPALAHRIGRLRRTKLRSPDLWDAVFEVHAGRSDGIRAALETRVLKPWISGQRVSLFHFTVPSAACTRASDDAALVWQCSLVEREHSALRRHYFSPSRTTKGADNWDSMKKRYFNTESAVSSVKSAAARQRDSVVVPSNAEDVGRALDMALDSLKPEAFSTRRPSEDDSSERTAVVDPVARAIQIRERLLNSVKLLDAAKWAKWRGVKSNPSAALGKYKRQNRVFAVRDSKQDLYPQFQFDENAEPRAGMQQLLQAVPEGVRGWSLLSWLEARNALLGGRKPSDVLAQDPTAVVRAAERFYSRDD